MRTVFKRKTIIVLFCLLFGLVGCLLTACGGGKAPADTVAETVAPVTDLGTESTTEKLPEGSAEEPTAEPTEAPTCDSTEAPTDELAEESTAESTEQPIYESTEAPTEEMTEAPTEEVTETPSEELKVWEQDTGVFNDGKVDYVKAEDGTVTATPREGFELGLDITDKTDIISICYSVWFDYILGSGTEPVTDWYNITVVQAGLKDWGPSPAFHYWAKPAQGYYRSSDKTAIRNNMTLIYNAGVDFIILDHTNLHNGYLDNADLKKRMIDDPMIALFDTIMEMRAEGLGTPYVVVWCGDNDGRMYQYLYDAYYSVEKWQDCFVYWDEKPLLLTTHTRPEDFPLKEQNIFTVRSMWGLGVDFEGGQWSYLNVYNYGRVTNGADGKPEQIGVAVAAQETYMSESTAHGRKGGTFWYCQWYYAFEVHPKVVTLTWWNEWTVQRIEIEPGKYIFTDNYNQEYSRDIEPMEGGHGDQYYQWLKQYVSYYKSGLDCPVLVEEKFVDKVDRFLQTAMRN